ncbi:MAG: PAC2 family protein [Armatimonadota bacterium]
MEDLILHERPEMDSPRLVVGLTGWMDGGHVSTATLGYLRERLAAERFAEIDPMDFYIFHFPVASIPVSVYLRSGPGSRPDALGEGATVVHPVTPMEFAAVFRPHAKITDGVVKEVVYPENVFWAAPESNLLLFTGEEPHIRWGSYCDCIFWVCEELGVREVYFVGSVASPMPHTREPRIRASTSRPEHKQLLADAGLGFADYEGPSSIITSLVYHAAEIDIAWRSLVVEIPHYPFLEMPTYPHSILKVTAALTRLLGLELNLSDLEEATRIAREKLDALMADNAEFRELVSKLEQAYDYAVSDEDEELLRRLIEGVDLEGGEQA